MNYDVVVIGGGASGMFAAAIASSCGKNVLILEKNKELGKKLKISGGGRCNITNAEPDARKYLARYEPNGDGMPVLKTKYLANKAEISAKFDEVKNWVIQQEQQAQSKK